MAACGGTRLQNTIHNAYAMGKLRMVASDIEMPDKVIKNRSSSKAVESGSFVLWQMNPDMWYVEIALGSSKVHTGSNGKLVWRHTPWLGAHASKGPVRPLRRVLQGLDPKTTASMFANVMPIELKSPQWRDHTIGMPKTFHGKWMICTFEDELSHYYTGLDSLVDFIYQVDARYGVGD